MDQTTHPRMVLTAEENEIIDFYRQGMTVAQLSEATGHTVYKLKKLLAYEPKILPAGYIWRSLFGNKKDTMPANELIRA